MNKALFFLIIIVFIASQSNAGKQGQEKIDSLFSVLKTAKEDTAKVNTVIALAIECYSKNPDTAFYFANEALALATKINYNMGIAEAHFQIGTTLANQGKFDEAIKNLTDALTLYDILLPSATTAYKSKILKRKGGAYNNMGVINLYQGNFFAGLKNFSASLSIYRETGDKKASANPLGNIGSIYYDLGNYPEALKNHFAALKIGEELGNKKIQASNLNNIGIIFRDQGNYAEALKYYFKALKLDEELGDKKGKAQNLANIGIVYGDQGNYTEALKHYLAALKLDEELGDKRQKALNLSNIGTLYKDHGNYNEALKYYLANIKITEEIGDKAQMAYSYINIGNIYTKLKKNTEASRCLTKGLSLATEIGSLVDIKESYSGLAALDSAKGDFKQSMADYKMCISYKDSLVNKENAKKTTQIQMQYEFDKKQHADSIQRASENRISLLNLQKQKVYTGLGIAGFILVVLLLFFVYRSYTLQRKATAEMAISSQKEEQYLKTEFKKQIAQAETKALRAQMNPHFIFNCLNSINSFIIDGNHEIASDYLIRFSKLIRLILDNSRSETISLEKELEALDLYVLLEGARFDNKFKCVYRIAENLDTSVIMIPPMLLQPFVENAIWHGLMHKETEGTITLEVKKENEEFLNISIIDDGIGREKAAELKSKTLTHKSHGLKVTSQRIEMMNKLNSTGAHVNIIDLKDEQGHASGTRVELIIPY